MMKKQNDEQIIFFSPKFFPLSAFALNNRTGLISILLFLSKPFANANFLLFVNALHFPLIAHGIQIFLLFLSGNLLLHFLFIHETIRLIAVCFILLCIFAGVLIHF